MVSVSSWLRRKALMSSIAQSKDIKVIPNVIDLEVFHPSDKLAARRKYSLPIEKKIILMGAVRIDDPVKGFFFLKEALNNLHMECGDILLVLLGEVKDSKILGDVSFPIIQLGFRSDLFEVAQLYSAVDVNVVPSFYETFGQTIIEAMACGCPSVSFNNSGQVDVIDHKKNGYLAAYKDAADLATGIDWVLNKADRKKLSFNARKKVEENYSEAVVAKQYIELYRSLLK
jgi:glycosyltransferase family 4